MQHVIDKMNTVPHTDEMILKVLELSPHVWGMEQYIGEDEDEVRHHIDDVAYETGKAKFMMENDGVWDEMSYHCWLAPGIAEGLMEKEEMYMYVIYWHNPNGEDDWDRAGNKYTEKMHEEECGWTCGWTEVDIDNAEGVMGDKGIDKIWLVGPMIEDDWHTMDLDAMCI